MSPHVLEMNRMAAHSGSRNCCIWWCQHHSLNFWPWDNVAHRQKFLSLQSSHIRLYERQVSRHLILMWQLLVDPQTLRTEWEKSSTNIIDQPVVSNQVVCVADWVAGCNYVYDNNGPIVSDCSRLGAPTAGCSIIRCCLPAQLGRNTDMMTHNWSFKALVYTSDSYWSWREPGVRENMHVRARWHTPKQ